MVKIGISPCPNDIFTFSGLLNGKIANSYEFKIGPIGDLNRWAQNDEVSIAKISAGTFPLVKEKFCITSVGASFGIENGPKLVVCADEDITDFNGQIVATPGLSTTASFVLKQIFPKVILQEENLGTLPALVRDRHVKAGRIATIK